MKKLFMLILGLLICCSVAKAEVILAPQWAEFCPVDYMDAKASKWSENSDYWYKRRIQFEQSLSRCDNYTGEDLKSCYQQVSDSERMKNRSWNAKVDRREREHQEYMRYKNTRDTVDAVNSIIRTFKY